MLKHEPRGTAALGCPAERSSAVFVFAENRVELRSTGQLRDSCPYAVCGGAADALCNEMVAFLRRTKVRCTLNAAVKAFNSSLYALSSKRFKTWPNSMRGVTLTRLATGSERPYGVVRVLHH